MSATSDKVSLDADFTELYRAHLRDVYSYAYYRIGNHHDAEDITEQTFLQAYRHFERAQREARGRPLRPWLIRIAHNLAANYYRDRSRKPQTNLEDAGVLPTFHDTEDLVEGREEVQEVLAGVAKLPDGPTRRADHALRPRHGQPRDRACARAHRRRHQGVDPSSDQAARGGARRMSEARFDVEALLRSALTPVEPPEALSDRLERHLTELTDLAAEELAEWELGAMRDPRNWVRPVAAATVIGVAGGALVVVRARQRSKKKHVTGLRALEQGLQDVVERVGRTLDR